MAEEKKDQSEQEEKTKGSSEFIDNVIEYIKVNNEDPKVQQFVGDLSKVTKDKVEGWLETEEGKGYIQPLFDRRVSQGINSYKENQFAQAVKAQVDAEMLKRNPAETPEQIRLREVEKKLEEQERARRKAEQTSIAVKYLSERGMNTGELVDRLVGESEEDTRMRIDQLAALIELEKKKAVNQVLASESRVPKSGESEDLMFTEISQLEAYLKKNPDKYEAVRPQYIKLANKNGG